MLVLLFCTCSGLYTRLVGCRFGVEDIEHAYTHEIKIFFAALT